MRLRHLNQTPPARGDAAKNGSGSKRRCAREFENTNVNSPAEGLTSSIAESPQGDSVWSRLWQHAPSAEKDVEVLVRERCGPRWRWMKESLRGAFGGIKGLRTIELGSGRGDLSVLLAEEGAEVTLLDANDSALSSATQRFIRLGLHGSYVRSDLRDAALLEVAPFDVALSIGVIEHFSGSARTDVLRAHHDVLRPGGLAIISVPYAWCVPYRIWKAYLEVRGWWPYGLEIPYSRRELAHRARAARFTSVEMYCFGFRQSLGVHWVKRLTGRRPDWSERPSVLDAVQGLSLVMIARRGESS